MRRVIFLNTCIFVHVCVCVCVCVRACVRACASCVCVDACCTEQFSQQRLRGKYIKTHESRRQRHTALFTGRSVQYSTVQYGTQTHATASTDPSESATVREQHTHRERRGGYLCCTIKRASAATWSLPFLQTVLLTRQKKNENEDAD